MMIEVKGVQFVNKGAELMLHAVLQQIKLRWPNAELVLAPNCNSPYIERAKLGAYQKLSLCKNIFDFNNMSYWIPKKIRLLLKSKWGLVTEADISLVLDASGFCYGDQWSSILIKTLAGEIERAAKNNKTYILLPQALGPFSRSKDISSLKSSLPKASLICARDETSFSHVENMLGKQANLIKFPDFTNLVKGVLPAYFVDGMQKVLIIPNSNMLSSRNGESQWNSHYLRVLQDAVAMIREQNLKPVLLNHEGAGDGAICEQVKQICEGEIELIHESDPLKVKGIIGASRAIICSRFHGCVSALSQGVPCLGTSWSHKYERLYEEYLQSECLITATIDKNQLAAAFIKATELSQSPSCIEARENYRLLSEQMWTKVEKITKAI